MSPNGWHYIAVKQLSVLLREITSKNNGFLLGFSLFVQSKKQP